MVNTLDNKDKEELKKLISNSIEILKIKIISP